MKHLLKLASLILLTVLALLSFVSCATPAADPKDAEAALEANGYEIHNDDEIAGEWVRLGVKKISKVVVAAKKGSSVTILYFSDSAAASTAYATVRENVTVEEVEVFEMTDAMIYFGDKDAVAAAQK